MYHINFNNPIHVHFIGIGGISMSGLAHILRDKNFTVSGSDAAESALTKELTAAGCHIVYSQTADNITSDIDLVVYTCLLYTSFRCKLHGTCRLRCQFVSLYASVTVGSLGHFSYDFKVPVIKCCSLCNHGFVIPN